MVTLICFARLGPVSPDWGVLSQKTTFSELLMCKTTDNFIRVFKGFFFNWGVPPFLFHPTPPRYAKSACTTPWYTEIGAISLQIWKGARQMPDTVKSQRKDCELHEKARKTKEG